MGTREDRKRSIVEDLNQDGAKRWLNKIKVSHVTKSK